MEDKYIKGLTNDEIKTLEIARNHLGDSFDMEKSIGFVAFKEKLAASSAALSSAALSSAAASCAAASCAAASSAAASSAGS